MTRTQLDDLIAQGEGTRLEFKRTLSSAHRIARTLAAFANTSGGTLLIGVADDRRILGVPSESVHRQPQPHQPQQGRYPPPLPTGGYAESNVSFARKGLAGTWARFWVVAPTKPGCSRRPKPAQMVNNRCGIRRDLH